MDTNTIVRHAIEYIEDRLDDAIELDHIADATAMSVPQLYRIFYAASGHSIKEYIRKRRISEAACLLRRTSLPIIEIGFECGFDSYQTFTKAFKKMTGVTPGVYRNSAFIFSFERIHLNERIPHKNDQKMIVPPLPAVKVIRLNELQAISYLHTSDQEDSLEEAAVSSFRHLLSNNDFDIGNIKLFGYNLELEGEQKRYGYQLMAVHAGISPIGCQSLNTANLPGGLYAVVRAPSCSKHSIITTWNRLLSEWLPKSRFMLGDHHFLDEYHHHNGKLTSVKLYLPIVRKQEAESIRIVERQSVQVITFRAKGADCSVQADNLLIEWLTINGLTGNK
ncbi:AraC-like DNA-binding protein/predicted transcriptional regulator YdeE [Paenibacillus castaneae]|uniref:helix-turn-helix domain-containing protein n=1 Tax=Paenibacillus castaneae TaxID=474957 RepID=UPI000C9AAC93|nr:helix-turn-helix domain-containing protein [Paenibacillus castaneae]NIK78832.1 AraC-like DNA-binding protein/predicted transcriptional regulator YdeE [Paenibacillus castaneae]